MLQQAVLKTQSLYSVATTFQVAGRVPPKKKIQRVRISWFILGIMVGSLLTLLLNGLIGLAQNGETTNFTDSGFGGRIPSAIANLTLGSQGRSISGASETDKEIASEKTPADPLNFVLTVRKGDTLSDMLTAKGVNYNEAHDLVEAMRPHYNPRSIVVGQKINLHLNDNKNTGADSDFDVAELSFKTSKTETLELSQAKKGAFDIKMQALELSQTLSAGGGRIRSSLYQTGVDSGVPAAILASVINAYSYDVDFQRDIHRGDRFNVIYETMRTEDDEIAAYGKMLYATLTLGGQEKKIYHFTRPNGEEGYYDESGQSVRKALLMTPINGARLSSGFGMRKHPIMGYSKMHKGIDFAAATGTPVYAAGDGLIDFSGRKGSYGNYIRVRHGNQFSTAYAHLSRIAPKARSGARVKQGDIIGFVGSTGASTGPHLHYEVLKSGTQVNPKAIKFPTGHKLEGSELASFRNSIKQINLMATRMIDGEPSLASMQTDQSVD